MSRARCSAGLRQCCRLARARSSALTYPSDSAGSLLKEANELRLETNWNFLAQSFLSSRHSSRLYLQRCSLNSSSPSSS